MERLSERLREILNEQDFCFDLHEMHDVQRALNRLAAYEDTGTEPEEIGDVVMHCKDLGLGGLLGLLNAIATDRLIVLPCKVGDTVWSGEPFVDKRICEGVIVEINIDAFGFCGFWASFTSRAIAAEFIKEDIIFLEGKIL